MDRKNSKAQKLHYLKNSYKEDVSGIIGSISNWDTNYILIEFYSNKKELINEIIKGYCHSLPRKTF